MVKSYYTNDGRKLGFGCHCSALRLKSLEGNRESTKEKMDDLNIGYKLPQMLCNNSPRTDAIQGKDPGFLRTVVLPVAKTETHNPYIR